jgi:biotin carboxyl carrier protein
MAYIVTIAEKSFRIEIKGSATRHGETIYDVVADGHPLSVSVVQVADPSHISLIIDNRSHDVVLDDHLVTLEGIGHEVVVEDELKKRFDKVIKGAGADQTISEMRAPMPGLVVAVEVSKGDKVSAGQGIAILEAMKMQNELRAPRDGVIKEIRVEEGAKVDGGDVLVVIEQAPPPSDS